MSDPAESLATVLAYHERTKHHPGRFARSLGHMDWATQPDPFRRFAGAPVLSLDLVRFEDQPRYEPAFLLGNVPSVPLGHRWVSQLFQDSLALSAWKQAGAARWSLRVNPSSGNLHPTEGYLIAGPVEGLADKPAVYHYAPHEHALERRVDLSDETWAALATQLPPGGVLVGLTSIHWRESWKYGERGFRYCQHDVGHAMGAVAVAAAGLGWEARLCEGVTDSDLARLLGVDLQSAPEAEDADCLLALSPQDAPLSIEQQRAFTLSDDALTELGVAQRSPSRGRLRALSGPPRGVPNRLSPEHGQHWPVIDEVAGATRKTEPPLAGFWHTPTLVNHSLAAGDSPLTLRPILAQRRSAVALDGHTGLGREAFFQILLKTIPGKGQVPFTMLPWRPRIDLLLFVHRVEGVPPGLYVLLRDPARKETLARLMTPGFAWTSPEGCPTSLPLFLLEAGDARRVAAQTSCGQDIAADGVFAAAMLAEYRAPLETFGAWFYRRLHWEAGVVGQQLYLEAEASGIRATGIGCFFDDVCHRTFEITGDAFQVLYHFTMGGRSTTSAARRFPPTRTWPNDDRRQKRGRLLHSGVRAGKSHPQGGGLRTYRTYLARRAERPSRDLRDFRGWRQLVCQFVLSHPAIGRVSTDERSFTTISDGGCGVFHVVADIDRREVLSLGCNGLA